MKPLTLGLAAVLLAPLALAAAPAVDAPIERYREAMESRELGSVKGRAFEERRRPTGPEATLTGVTVTLMPRSEAWLLRLNAIKRGARDSMDTYRQAGLAVRQARETYEKSLLEAGAGDLAQGATVDSEGRFTIDGIPAGPWVLLAARLKYVSKAPQERPVAPGTPGRAPTLPMPFLAPDKLAGYSMVTYWLRELTITGGGVETVELTDRNFWFSGIIESRMAPKLPDQPYQPRR